MWMIGICIENNKREQQAKPNFCLFYKQEQAKP